MALFLHRRDGKITLGDFVTDLDEFLVEEPGYSLPPGFVERRYDSTTGHHILFSDRWDQRAGEEPWPEGEDYLTRKAAIRARIENKRPPPNLPPTPTERLEDRLAQDAVFDAFLEILESLLNLPAGELSQRLRAKVQEVTPP